jgi:hypothetical protein
MAALQDELPSFGRKEKLAFLLDHSDALAASAGFELMRYVAVEKTRTGERGSAPEIICSSVDLPLALGRERRRLRRLWPESWWLRV